MEATRTSVTSGNEQIGYNMDPAYQVGYTQQEVDGKNLKFVLSLVNFQFYCKLDLHFCYFFGDEILNVISLMISLNFRNQKLW